MDLIKQTLEDWSGFITVLRDLVILSVTLFTAWWTYRTFSYKEKVEEMKKLTEMVWELDRKIRKYCFDAGRNTNKTRGDWDREVRRMSEGRYGVLLHNYTNYFSSEATGRKVRGIVFSWLNAERLRPMLGTKVSAQDSEKWKEAWRVHNAEMKEVCRIIREEATGKSLGRRTQKGFQYLRGKFKGQ